MLFWLEGSMEEILERYERYCYAENQLAPADSESQQQGSSAKEYPRLLSKLEVLQRNMRHYVGEGIDSLTLKELQHLEQQLETALRRIRNRKVKENNNTEATQQQNPSQDCTLSSSNPARLCPSLSIGGAYDEGRESPVRQVNHMAEGRADTKRSRPPWMVPHVD
ncbi:hypothetical protein Cgig2_007681 [Carnegiea gigantea]|uniref:K-box domain-containing protein n=1 Tax=Carnegiea gigantea TaxID=171969 RepID=A0A9Q1K427_9CARY|nr:hypothetical protein Cgig2_007681 [Carnegiea gigantea]